MHNRDPARVEGCLVHPRLAAEIAQAARVRDMHPAHVVAQRVRSAVQGMTTAPLASNGVPRSIRTTIQGAETTILVEARDSRSTAVHVNSQNAKVANRLQAALR